MIIEGRAFLPQLQRKDDGNALQCRKDDFDHGEESKMTNDADWVEDVRRWYFNGGRLATVSKKDVPVPVIGEASTFGYEAANPGVETSGWAKPVPSSFGSLS